ncbi:lipid A biosynthesis acyltransferase [Flaviaesturariibacter flavus]|uniref:Lipid A biosynthesis acyltransferase n=2 Tax=Flaviaesturariibacter flavus TaxID=2502780 RepID=A0A4R1BB02_9BACT|nr:lipid A biosynthesis acyltransferase [Flaviaesturariibacter flavus]
MYYVLYGLLYVLSLLPLRVLYLLSDLGFFIVYHLLGYRKEVVLANLRTAFPQKTEEERVRIARRFYYNFTDNFIESIKFISAPPRFFEKHFTGDFSQVHELWKDGRPVHFHVGHNFNWELANLAMPRHLPGQLVAVYMPLHARAVDRLFYKIRSRFGTKLAAATRLGEDMLPFRGQQYVFALIADQSPPVPSKAVWTRFFGQPTGFIRTPEAAARRNDYPVFFAHYTKKKRGYYEAHVELATDHPRQLPEGELTKRYANFLERVMSEHPELWLWSHRRWKKAYSPEWKLVE